MHANERVWSLDHIGQEELHARWLLIVIVILSLLLGLLIPSIQSISRQSLVTADFENLRSLQSAHTYAVDSKGRFDAGCMWPGQ